MEGCDWPYFFAGFWFDLEEVELQTFLHLTGLLLGRGLLRAQPRDLHKIHNTLYIHNTRKQHNTHFMYTTHVNNATHLTYTHTRYIDTTHVI